MCHFVYVNYEKRRVDLFSAVFTRLIRNVYRTVVSVLSCFTSNTSPCVCFAQTSNKNSVVKYFCCGLHPMPIHCYKVTFWTLRRKLLVFVKEATMTTDVSSWLKSSKPAVNDVGTRKTVGSTTSLRILRKQLQLECARFREVDFATQLNRNVRIKLLLSIKDAYNIRWTIMASIFVETLFRFTTLISHDWASEDMVCVDGGANYCRSWKRHYVTCLDLKHSDWHST